MNIYNCMIKHPDIHEVSLHIPRYSNPSWLKSHYPDWYEELLNLYPNIKNLSEKLYLYFHNLPSPPLCTHCHQNPVVYLNFRTGYRKYCSRKCTSIATRTKASNTTMERYGVAYASQSPEVQERIKQTNLERYGCTNPMGSKKIRAKLKQTNLERYGSVCPLGSEEVRAKASNTTMERYGVAYASQSPEVQERIKQTNLERYGVEHVFQSPEVQERIRQTNLERYGSVCPLGSEEVRAKGRATCLERYGTEYALQSQEVQERIKQTNLERYGTEYASQSQEIQERIKQTNLERYGVEHAFQSPEIQERIKQTNLERYGTEYALQSPEVQERIKQTNLERYGCTSSLGSEEVRAKGRATCLERYGAEYASQSQEIQERIKQTNLERYGTEYASQSQEIQERIKQTNLERYGVEHHKQRHLPDTYSAFIRVENGYWRIECPHPECNKCEEHSFLISSNHYYDRLRRGIETCTHLLPVQESHHRGTTIELFVRAILDEYKIVYTTNDRSIIPPQEVDLYLPDYHIAIECNGIYWHSQLNNNYHHNKWLACKKAGVQLLTIWEDWIVNKPDIVRSIILSKLGIYKHRIGARQCELRTVDTHTSESFLTQKHIQGACRNSMRYGLYYQNELVALMTFGKTQAGQGNHRQPEWILSRFCNKVGWQVVGGASRLMSIFVHDHQPDYIASYASNDISDGHLYKQLGFEEMHINRAYWYIDNKMSRHHRTAFTKRDIIRKGLLLPDHSNWTENEVMKLNGYMKICDSGICKWVWRNKTPLLN